MLALAFCDLWWPWPSPEDPWIGTSLWRDYLVTATPLVLVAVALHSEDGGSSMLFSCPACSAVPSDHLPSGCVLLLRAQSPGMQEAQLQTVHPLPPPWLFLHLPRKYPSVLT